MTHRERLQNPKYKNWVKGGLALKYLHKGLSEFAQHVAVIEHQEMINSTGIATGAYCSFCEPESIKPIHKSSQCPRRQIGCNCAHRNTKKCPNNICDTMYDEIMKYQGSDKVNWNNSDIRKWTTDPWEVAKCYINAPGYKNTHSAAETDVGGLLHLFINNTKFQAHVDCEIGFIDKIRTWRYDMFHSPVLELEDQTLADGIADIISFLEDDKELRHFDSSKQSVLNLKELQNESFIITSKNEMDIGREAKAAFSKIIDDLIFKKEPKGKLSSQREIEMKQIQQNIEKIFVVIETRERKLTDLKAKAHKLLEEKQEFVKFFEKRPERYISYIQLLCEGGQLVLAAFLKSECSKREQGIPSLIDKYLEAVKKERGVSDNLEDFKQEHGACDNLEVVKKALKLGDFDTLQSLLVTVPEKWDILHLATLILLLFKDTLTSKETKHITELLNARISLEKLALNSLDEGSFSNLHLDLVHSLTFLSRNLGEEVEEQCKICIDSSKVGNKGSDVKREEEYFERLRRYGVRIQDVYKDVLNELKDAMEKLENEYIGFQTEPVLRLKIVTLGTNEQKRRLAEQTVEAVWQAALKGSPNSDDFDAVRQTVEEIIAEIRKHNIRTGEGGGIDSSVLGPSLQTAPVQLTTSETEVLSEEKNEEETCGVELMKKDDAAEVSAKPLTIDPRLLSSKDRGKRKDKGEVGGIDSSVLGPSLQTAPLQLTTSETEVLSEEKNEVFVDWETCIKQLSEGKIITAEKIAAYQFKIKGLPDQQQLNRLQEMRETSHSIVSEACKRICLAIQSQSEHISNVWPAYKFGQRERVVFVVETNTTHVLNLDTTYNNVIFSADYFSENRKVAMKVVNSDKELPQSETEPLVEFIKKNAAELFKKHRNLSYVKPSLLRQEDSHNDEHISGNFKAQCLACYVRRKDYIHLDEEPFDNYYGGFPAVVREGAFSLQTGTKIGCGITCLQDNNRQYQVQGTLGGFVEHPYYGLCGLTSAHVLLNAEEMQELKQCRVISAPKEPAGLLVCSAAGSQIGRIVKVVYEDGSNWNSGMEIALFQIETDHPKTAEFEGCNQENFMKGRVYGDTRLCNGVHVYKLGANRTEGEIIGIKTMTVRTHEKFDALLYSQIEVKPVHPGPFSENGDSGSLVFIKEDDEYICIGMIVGGSAEPLDNNTRGYSSVVSPIVPVLYELNVTAFKCFVTNSLEEKFSCLNSNMQRMQASISSIQTDMESMKAEILQRLDSR